jgi:hypothetical protein
MLEIELLNQPKRWASRIFAFERMRNPPATELANLKPHPSQLGGWQRITDYDQLKNLRLASVPHSLNIHRGNDFVPIIFHPLSPNVSMARVVRDDYFESLKATVVAKSPMLAILLTPATFIPPTLPPKQHEANLTRRCLNQLE